MSAENLITAKEFVREAKSIVAFTGAGISTESGLSDFRSPGGLWERYRTVTHQEFLVSKEARFEYWEMRRELIPMLLKAGPNRAHKALADLETAGKLTAVITQNIDGLHQEAGSINVIELHGTNRTASCLSCHKQWIIEDIQKRLEAGDLDPHCDLCDGLINPDTVSFGQEMPQVALDAAFYAARNCDLMFMIGSSLEVYPASAVPAEAFRNGAKLIFINRTATPQDGCADLLIRGSAGDFFEAVMDDF